MSNDIDDVVACVDCKYYHKTLFMRILKHEARCTHGYEPSKDLVTGKVIPMDFMRLIKCRDERDNLRPDRCSMNGNFWEPREHTPANTFRVLKRTGQGANEN